MKFRKALGSEAVQDLIREAHERVKELPPISFRDPWPSSRRFEPEEVAAFFADEMAREKAERDKG
jgi:hypothetical protein